MRNPAQRDTQARKIQRFLNERCPPKGGLARPPRRWPGSSCVIRTKDIQKRDLARRYAKPKLKHLSRIAIDENAVASGHRYLTVVLDLDSGAVVFVGDGKCAGALKPFWKRLRPSEARIEAVAM